MSFQSGEIVKNLVPVIGVVQAYRPELNPVKPLAPGVGGPPGAGIHEEVDIPKGYTGEVLSSDDIFTTAIYPINTTGKLEPMLIKVEDFTKNFKKVVRHNPFVWERDRDVNNPGKPRKAGITHWIDGFHPVMLINGEFHQTTDPEWDWHYAILENLGLHDDAPHFAGYRGLYNPQTKTLLHMTAPDEYQEMLMSQESLSLENDAFKPVPEIPTQEQAAIQPSHKDEWLKGAQAAGVPVENYGRVYSTGKGDVMEMGTDKVKWQIESKTSHWIPGFHAAVLTPEIGFGAREGKYKFFVASGSPKTHTSLLREFGRAGGRDFEKSFRGLYNPDTQTLLHISAPDEYWNMDWEIYEEEFAKQFAQTPQMQEWKKMWIEAAEEAGTPVKQFGIATTDYIPPDLSEEGFPIEGTGRGTNPNWRNEVGVSFIEAGVKMKKVAHWMPGWYAALYDPEEGMMFVADSEDDTHTDVSTQLGDTAVPHTKYYRGLYHPEKKILAHLSTPMQAQQYSEFTPWTEDDHRNEWLVAAETNNIPVKYFGMWINQGDFMSGNHLMYVSWPQDRGIIDLQTMRPYEGSILDLQRDMAGGLGAGGIEQQAQQRRQFERAVQRPRRQVRDDRNFVPGRGFIGQ